MTFTLNTLEINNCNTFNIVGEMSVDTSLTGSFNVTITNLTTNETSLHEDVDFNQTEFTIEIEIENTVNLTDGVYNVLVSYYNTTPTLEAEDSTCVLSLCELCCKVKKLATKVVIKDCGNCNEDNNKDILKFIEADALLSAIKYGGACGSITEINQNIENLQEFLLNINCKNC